MKWDLRFLTLAEHVAEWSKDPSTKVGAVIVRPDKTVAAVGYNGFPRGCSDAELFYRDREDKLARTVHAELNAILTAQEPVRGYTIYCSHHPCANCTACIIQAGIKRVVYQEHVELENRWGDSMARADVMLSEAHIDVFAFK